MTFIWSPGNDRSRARPSGSNKTVDRFFGATDNWLVFVEGRVQHDRHPVRRANASIKRQYRVFVSRWTVCTGQSRRRVLLLESPIASPDERCRLEHEGIGIVLIEVVCDRLGENRRGEGPERLAVLDPGIENVLHVDAPGVGQDAAVTQRAWSPTPSAPGTSRRRVPPRPGRRNARRARRPRDKPRRLPGGLRSPRSRRR